METSRSQYDEGAINAGLIDIASVLEEGEEDVSFDKFTSFASLVLDVPVALVSIIDHRLDRQVFKGQIGLSEPWVERQETPLSHSFCQHVASTDKMFCVEDARINDTVKDNLAIAELGVIAYLGFPVRDNHGNAIGAFCVINGEPRKWTDRDKEVVVRIADCVTDVFKMKLSHKYASRSYALKSELSDIAIGSLKSELNSLVTMLDSLALLQDTTNAVDLKPLVKKCKSKTRQIEDIVHDIYESRAGL